MVGAKRMRCLSPTWSTVDDRVSWRWRRGRGSTIRVTSKTALRSGSSKQGKARRGVHRLELGGGHGVGLAVRPGVGGAVEAAQLVVEGAAEPAADGAGPGGSRSAGWKVTCSSSSSKRTLHRTVIAVGRQDLDVADRQLGRVEHDLARPSRGRWRRSARSPRRWPTRCPARSRCGRSPARSSAADGTAPSRARRLTWELAGIHAGYPRCRG